MPNIEIKSDFSEYVKIFLSENSKVNLISKKEEKVLLEKHVYDSLGLKLFLEKYDIKKGKILDIGCGGGFPCVPLAIECPEFKITGVDSIQKKINAVNNIKNYLGIDNLTLICTRAENLKEKYDIAVSRAVGELSKILEYGLPLLNNGGYFVAYKSKKGAEEISKAEKILKKFDSKVVDVIECNLQLEEVYERNLIIVRKEK